VINLVRNPGLESGDDGSWIFTSECSVPGGNIIGEPANARSGVYRMMVRAGKAGFGTQTCGTWSQDVPVKPGFLHRFSVYYKVPVINAAVEAEVLVKGVQSASAYFDFVLPQIVQPAYVQTIPAVFDPMMHGDTAVTIQVMSRPPLTNPGFFNFYFDDFSLEQITFPRQGTRGFIAG
jgi:hypothetical protein